MHYKQFGARGLAHYKDRSHLQSLDADSGLGFKYLHPLG